MSNAHQTTNTAEAPTGAVGMAAAIRCARSEAHSLTGLPVDAIGSAQRTPDGGWTVVVDVIESVARMGDNDLLTSYEMVIDATGALSGMSRLARYRREDRG